MMTLANELEAHGYGDETDDVYRRIVQWYEADVARPTPPRSGLSDAYGVIVGPRGSPSSLSLVSATSSTMKVQ